VPATCEHKFCPDGGLMSSAGMKTKATGFMLQALLRPLGS
jgi:hypothetical protein